RQQCLEPGARGGRRELKVFRWHMTIGARASVAAKCLEVPVVEGCTTACDLVTRLLCAVELDCTVALSPPRPAARARDDDPQETPHNPCHDAIAPRHDRLLLARFACVVLFALCAEAELFNRCLSHRPTEQHSAAGRCSRGLVMVSLTADELW